MTAIDMTGTILQGRQAPGQEDEQKLISAYNSAALTRKFAVEIMDSIQSHTK